MSAAEIGLGLQSDKRAEDYAQLARLAEEHGFDVVSVFGDLMFQPPLFPLLEMARVTRRVRLGAACMNPYSMHPYEIAGQLAALDLASGGRGYLGLARGTWLEQVGIMQPRPLAHLEEAVEVIYRLLSGQPSGFDGEVFHLRPGTALRYPVQRFDPPLLIGTWGLRTSALAGRVAHHVKVGGSANPAMVTVMRERIEVGTRAVGRAPDEVGVVMGAVTVVDEDAEAARAVARREVAMYFAVVSQHDPTVEVPEELRTEVARLVAAGEHEAAGRLIPDDLLDLFAFSGDPDQVAAQAQSVIDAGAARIEFGTPHGLTDASGITLLGTRVLPQLVR